MKDRRHRVADISTARFVLDNVERLAAPADAGSVLAPHRTPLWRRVITPAAAAIVAGAAVGALVWVATRPAAAPHHTLCSITNRRGGVVGGSQSAGT